MTPATFWEKVQKGDEVDCWPWLGSRNAKGYGNRVVCDGRGILPHRLAYELAVGPIPEGLTIDHLCRVTCCCNPAHMEPVTASENSRRLHAARTHCRYGHELTPENARHDVVKGGPVRRCVICSRAAWQRYNAKRVSYVRTPRWVPVWVRKEDAQ